MNRIRRRFMDKLRLHVKGGPGGMGFPRFGGVGGRGGDIYIQAQEGLNLIKTLKINETKRWSANAGGNSRKHRIFGEQGEDVIISVPQGVTVKVDGGAVLGELNSVGEKLLVARGGAGGSPVNGYSGQKGQALNINLELKLLADIGLVGFPNAGKSTLLRAISNAKPRIASYPFTTLSPYLGMLEYNDGRQITMADLPGLIEGAWANVGMGHSFLRHVERTKLLLFVVDINGFQLGPKYPHRTATENVILLNKELELYRWDLVDKPAVLMVNKMDTANAEEKLADLVHDLGRLPDVSKEFPEEYQPEHWVTFSDVVPCSARENTVSINYLKDRLRNLIDIHADLASSRALIESSARDKVVKLSTPKGTQLI